MLRLLPGILLTGSILLWLLHWVHLGADFPNFSPWMDYAKYTDEGWYGNAAMRAILRGNWYLHGDFNPAVALPVWPALEWAVFRCFGVSVDAARGLALVVFGGNLAMTYALLRAAHVRHLLALGGVLLLAGNAYLWAFSRLAILEPLLTFWILASWCMALKVHLWRGWQHVAGVVSIGLLSCLAVLTKTTGLFLLPATAWLLFAAARPGHPPVPDARNRLPRLRDICVAAVAGLVPWLAYYWAITRRYSLDFHYLFQANQWDGPKGLHDHLLAFWWAAHGVFFMGPSLVAVIGLVLGIAMIVAPRLRRSPLLLACLLAGGGYVFFIGWHNNPQPRYYMVLVYPVVFAAVVCVEELARQSRWRIAGTALLAFGGLLAHGIYGSVFFALHPRYTLQAAANGVTEYIRLHTNGENPLLLSISGDEITLYTHQPAICDDFGTYTLPTRIARYRPGWYAEWNDLDPGTLEDIHAAGYRLQPVGHWLAFDDEDRNDLILYRMIPTSPNPGTAFQQTPLQRMDQRTNEQAGGVR